MSTILNSDVLTHTYTTGNDVGEIHGRYRLIYSVILLLRNGFCCNAETWRYLKGI